MLTSNRECLEQARSYALSYLWQGWVQCRPQLFGRALRLTGGDADAAEDLLSATILKVANHFDGKPVELREPRAFFLYALKNEFISQYRKKKNEAQYRIGGIDVYEDRFAVEDAQNVQQDEKLLQREQLEQLQAALVRLPEVYQRIFSLKFVEEKGYPEISEELEISQALARKRVQFLRQKLRASVGY
ncbi:sigma-70 family RNA polymerase sigma factor [Rhodobacteraceae bacterium RKSG542]|uniref:RNA polymerase sigma factor n=1 Tax=Pseudovibrio flavus TaxID=2529854 RepID=UPI0012BBDA6A|nr:sigma-70 family RNA polymerase sigma factor [Pseudovibrio flavus]MTI19200.1 sigma-70 family RNA polymerase sigma factor [Pseudovibrio flavus]